MGSLDFNLVRFFSTRPECFVRLLYKENITFWEHPMSQAKVLTEAEFKRVLAVIDFGGKLAARNRLVVMLSFLGGMRAGEIAALKLHHVVNEDGTVRDRIHLMTDETKGNRGRTVIMGRKLQKEIARYLEKRGKYKMDAPLIASQKRGHFSATTMVMLFRRIFDAAGIKDARSHSGRRNFLTKLAQRGCSVFVMQKLAGHRSIQTTQRYVTVNEAQLVSASNLL